MSNPLEELANLHNTDKGTLPHGHAYTDVYYKYWKEIQDSVKSVLEIGIWRGASLKTLRDFFHNAEIYAIDVQDGVEGGRGEPIGDLLDGDRITTYLCDQTDQVKLNELFGNMQFDIIIDDGCHNTLYQQKSLSYLFDYVKPGGLYVVEDLHTSLMGPQWGLYPEDSYTCLNILKRYKDTGEISSPHLSPEKIDYLNNNIESIEVYDLKRTVPIPRSLLYERMFGQTKCDLTAVIKKRTV